MALHKLTVQHNPIKGATFSAPLLLDSATWLEQRKVQGVDLAREPPELHLAKACGKRWVLQCPLKVVRLRLDLWWG